MIKRILAASVGVLSAGNGLMMLVAGERWYEQTPGVTDTGPYNPHFVADIGAAYAVAGLALAARAWRPAYWPAALAGSAFFISHALIHLAGLIGGHSHHAQFEIALVIIPAAVSLYAALPEKGAGHA